ncbi:MAG: sodium-dependent transporter [Bacteroidales bacterium]|jgi:SNF family Na+-dependent transporter|nr:sodium-dependent transporter [Bacteroidales bacterium]
MGQNESWGNRIGLVLAMAGNAVGFGNFLRFPVQAIENGGGAFIIPYIVCFILLGIPLMFVEWTLGRFAGHRGAHSPPFILEKMGGKRKIWRYVGVFGIFSTLGIACYYCYLESWTLSYIYHSVMGSFNAMPQSQVAAFFADYHDINSSHSGIPFENIAAFVLCLALNIWILSRGIQKGIEKVAKIGVPLLIIFGIFLAIKGVTIKAGENGALVSGITGLNFLWTPKYTSLYDPKVWLAAAGQIFFTLSIGMGCIQCYASYLKRSDDVALGALSTCFVNEFVEIVLGGTILLSIAIGFVGLDSIQSLVANEGGFGIAFQTMPYLFSKWGAVMGAICGVAFFGLLFLAGITSSLAMCSPAQAFLKDEFKYSSRKSALLIGGVLILWGLPTVLFYKKGVFDEYDYWVGTVCLFFFAMMECILFSWGAGIKKNWKELNRAADIKIPKIFKYILTFVTPAMLIIIFFAALIKPQNDEWNKLSFKGWEVDASSLIGKLTNKNVGFNRQWIADTLYSDVEGVCKSVRKENNKIYVDIASLNTQSTEEGYTKTYSADTLSVLLIEEGTPIKAGTPLMKGRFINNVLYLSLSRYYLVLLFLIVLTAVVIAARKRKKQFQIKTQ